MDEARRYRSGSTAPKRAGPQCWIGCAASTRKTGALSGSTSCGCSSAGRLGGHWWEASKMVFGKCARRLSQRIARLILCFHSAVLVVLHGFIKKTQQTPEEELDLAVKRQKEVESGKTAK